MARPPSPTPLIHKNFNLPEDVIDIIDKEQGKDTTEKLVNLTRKTQKPQQNPLKESIYYHEQKIKKYTELIQTYLKKIDESITQKKILELQEKQKQENEKAIESIKKGEELRQIFNKNIINILNKPNITMEEMKAGWIQLISKPEYSHIEYAQELFDLFLEDYNANKKIKETQEKEEMDREIEQEDIDAKEEEF